MNTRFALPLVFAGAIALAGCGNTVGDRGLSGAGIGAAGGAVIGAMVGAPLAGAAIGAGAGRSITKPICAGDSSALNARQRDSLSTSVFAAESDHSLGALGRMRTTRRRNNRRETRIEVQSKNPNKTKNIFLLVRIWFWVLTLVCVVVCNFR